MNKKLFGSMSVLFLLLIALFSFSSSIYASVTPTLSLAGNGDGDTVALTVSGDPNTSVILFYSKTGTTAQQITPIGTTNANGSFTASLSTSNYGIVAGSSVYVATGSISGPQSTTVLWPAVASLLSASNMLSLSQTGLVLQIAQSATVTATNLNSGSIYMSSNSSPAIANFGINGSTITVTGNSYGSTTGTFCLVSNTANCGSIYVIVQNTNAQPLSFSQSSVTLSSGQTVAVQISGGSGSYSVLNNSTQNGGTVQTSISGSIISLTTSSTTGSSSVTVCSTSMTSCGIINVTIGSSNTSLVSFSQNNPTVAVAQTLNVSIFGPTNSLFYVSANTNPSVVQANLSGSTLSLLGIANGISTLSVCASSSNCGSMTVTVNSNSSTGGNIILSQSAVNMSIGQTANITISGGAMPYSILSNGSNLVQSSLNNNVLSLYALANGTSLMNVCSSGGNCATVSINVSGANATVAGPLLTPVVSTTTPSDCTGANPFSGSTGKACSNYIAPVPVPTPVVAPTPTSVTAVATPTPAATPAASGTAFKFTKTTNLGSKGTEVSQLQTKLKALGFYKGKVDGGYGTSTMVAVKAFQKAHKLPTVGSVGPQTRALLNK